MKWIYYYKRIRKETVDRYDVTPLFSDPKVFSNLVVDILAPFKETKFNKIVGIDALGFILAGAIALKIRKPLIVARKGGKLTLKSRYLIRKSFRDYSGKKKSLEMVKGAVDKMDKCLIVDEWIETGSQVKAVISLLEKQGAEVVGIASIAAERNIRTEILFKKYNCKPIRRLGETQ